MPATIVLFVGLLFAQGTVGIFQGVVLPAPAKEAGKYLYIQGKNGNLRRVLLGGAQVRYADSVPPSERTKSAAEWLRERSEVRVTAENGRDGEWKAREIVILRIPRRKVQARFDLSEGIEIAETERQIRTSNNKQPNAF